MTVSQENNAVSRPTAKKLGDNTPSAGELSKNITGRTVQRGAKANILQKGVHYARLTKQGRTRLCEGGDFLKL
jgi:hypothetical protein